jgi:hypothetical protein
MGTFRTLTLAAALAGAMLTLPSAAFADGAAGAAGEKAARSAAGAADAGAAAELWSNAEGPVADAYDMRQASEFYLGEDAERYRRRLETLLEEAAEILSTSAVSGERTRLREIRQEVADKRAEVEDLRVKLSKAPEAATDFVGIILDRLKAVVRPTKEDYRARIAGTEQEIEQLREEAVAVKRRFAEGLRQMGVEITDAQAEGMLSMATADELADVLSIFHNMKAINGELMQATVRSDESLDVARRYYGLHTTMLEVALFMHEIFVERVDKHYLAELEDIEVRARKLQAEAQGLLRRTQDPELQKVLRNNLNSHDLTIRAAGLYERRLRQQRASIQEARRKLAERVQVARNTWRTVQVSSELVSMLRSTDKAFQALMNLELPDLRPFESIELQREFQRLTEEIEGAPSS